MKTAAPAKPRIPAKWERIRPRYLGGSAAHVDDGDRFWDVSGWSYTCLHGVPYRYDMGFYIRHRPYFGGCMTRSFRR